MDFNNFSIQTIFPTAILTNNISRKFTEEEYNYINNCLETRISNVGNTTSLESYVLDNPALADLKKSIEACIDYYKKEILCPKDDIEIYITQSWLNVSEKGQHHHIHNHTNSFLSGVFYIQTDDKNNKITFHRDRYDMIKLIPKEFNEYNSKSWWLPAEVGNIIIFPSHLQHDVSINESNEPRISLSFNTFIRGTVGEAESLTKIVLR